MWVYWDMFIWFAVTSTYHEVIASCRGVGTTSRNLSLDHPTTPNTPPRTPWTAWLMSIISSKNKPSHKETGKASKSYLYLIYYIKEYLLEFSPNLTVILQIYMTLPITSFEDKRSF